MEQEEETPEMGMGAAAMPASVTGGTFSAFFFPGRLPGVRDHGTEQAVAGTSLVMAIIG